MLPGGATYFGGRALQSSHNVTGTPKTTQKTREQYAKPTVKYVIRLFVEETLTLFTQCLDTDKMWGTREACAISFSEEDTTCNELMGGHLLF